MLSSIRVGVFLEVLVTQFHGFMCAAYLPPFGKNMSKQEGRG